MAKSQREMTTKAAESFRDYVGMGAGRSLRSLAARYVEQGRYKTRTTAFNILGVWSGEYGWQERLAEAVTTRTMALLAEAAELDADTYLATSREYRRRTSHNLDSAQLDAIHGIRDRIKGVALKGDPTLTVKHTHDHKHDHRHYDLSRFTPEEVRDLDTLAAKYEATAEVDR